MEESPFNVSDFVMDYFIDVFVHGKSFVNDIRIQHRLAYAKSLLENRLHGGGWVSSRAFIKRGSQMICLLPGDPCSRQMRYPLGNQAKEVFDYVWSNSW